jgi:hypothetical protein
MNANKELLMALIRLANVLADHGVITAWHAREEEEAGNGYDLESAGRNLAEAAEVLLNEIRALEIINQREV